MPISSLSPLAGLTLKTAYGIDYLMTDNDLFWNPIMVMAKAYGGYATSNFAGIKTRSGPLRPNWITHLPISTM